MQKVRKAEEERLRQEAKEREKERIMQEHEQIKKKTVRERLEQIKKTELGAKAFKDIDIEVTWFVRFNCILQKCVIGIWSSKVRLTNVFLQDLEELDPDFIMAKQVEQLEKEKKELQERLKNQEKKVTEWYISENHLSHLDVKWTLIFPIFLSCQIDYFERAKRLEEIPLIKKAYEEQRIKDMELWELQEEERVCLGGKNINKNNPDIHRSRTLKTPKWVSRI